jgi:hypothetical protein
MSSAASLQAEPNERAKPSISPARQELRATITTLVSNAFAGCERMGCIAALVPAPVIERFWTAREPRGAGRRLRVVLFHATECLSGALAFRVDLRL